MRWGRFALSAKKGSSMFCTRCGAEIADGARFCSQCGAPVEPAAASVQPEAFEPEVAPAEETAPEFVGESASEEPAYTDDTFAHDEDPAFDPYARFRAPKRAMEPEPEPELEPEAVPEPEPEPVHTLSPLAAAPATLEPAAEQEPVSEPVEETLPVPEPVVLDSKLDAAQVPEGDAPAALEPESVAELEPEPVTEPEFEPESVVEPMPEPEMESVVETEPELATESVSAPEPSLELKPEPAPIPEPVTNPEPSPSPEPESTPAPETSALAEPSPEAPAPTPAQKPKSQLTKTTKVAIGAVIIALLAGGGGAGYYFGIYKPEQERIAQEAYEAAHSLHAVTIAVTASDWDTGRGASRLPVRIVGKDLDKKKVDKIQYVDSSGKGIELKQGSYEVTVPASPIAGNGTIYTVPDTTVKIAIDSDAEKDQSFDISSDHGFELVPTDPAEVTDEQIQSAYEFATEDKDWDSSNPDALRDAATSKRDEAVAAAARHVDAGTFEFDLPAAWDGRVTFLLDTQGAVHMFSSKFPDYEVFSLFLYDSTQTSVPASTDPFKQNILTTIQGTTQAALTATNYGNIQASIDLMKESVGSSVSAVTTDDGQQYTALPDDVCAELIDLQTGGQRSLADFQADVRTSGYGKALFTAPLDYLSQAILPTVKVTSGQ